MYLEIRFAETGIRSFADNLNVTWCRLSDLGTGIDVGSAHIGELWSCGVNTLCSGSLSVTTQHNYCDWDNDGMSDAWETTYFGDLSQTATDAGAKRKVYGCSSYTISWKRS